MGRNREARVEPTRSFRRLRRERLVIGDDGRSRGEVARGSRTPRSRDIDVDFRLLTPRSQRTGRNSRCENVGKCEGGNVVVGPMVSISR